MIIAICMVKATRSQNPAPNHCADWRTLLPAASVARNTRTTAVSASANASGNHRSNQSDRRSPTRASRVPAGFSWTCAMLRTPLLLQDTYALFLYISACARRGVRAEHGVRLEVDVTHARRDTHGQSRVHRPRRHGRPHG